MPPVRALAVLRATLEDGGGRVLVRNFTSFAVGEGASPRDETLREGERSLRVLRVAPGQFAEARFSVRQWPALDGRKQNGAGAGAFEYRLPWPAGLGAEAVEGASFVAELGAKQLFGKDRPEKDKVQGDFMLGRGTHDPGLNRNAYPMTDGVRYPSAVRVVVNGVAAGAFELPDDPADHRGLLSWHAQKRDGHLARRARTAISSGDAVPRGRARRGAGGRVPRAARGGRGAAGGLAVYGEASAAIRSTRRSCSCASNSPRRSSSVWTSRLRDTRSTTRTSTR